MSLHISRYLHVAQSHNKAWYSLIYQAELDQTVGICKLIGVTASEIIERRSLSHCNHLHLCLLTDHTATTPSDLVRLKRKEHTC